MVLGHLIQAVEDGPFAGFGVQQAVFILDVDRVNVLLLFEVRPDVRAYLEEEEYVYTVNIKNEYCLLNTATGEWAVFHALNEVPEDHKETFLKLSSR